MSMSKHRAGINHDYLNELSGGLMKAFILVIVLGVFSIGMLFSSDIDGIEYFFDNDPGFGNGTQIYGRNTVDVNLVVNASLLPAGIHRLFVRARNTNGVWGLPQSKVIFVQPPSQAHIPENITLIEYYIDVDPGMGLGIPVSVNPAGDFVQLNLPLAVGSVSEGIHYLCVRAKNSAGRWGIPARKSFSNGIPVNVIVQITEGVLTLTWNPVEGVDSYQIYSSETADGGFAPDATGVMDICTWTAPIITPVKFYRVTSAYNFREVH